MEGSLSPLVPLLTPKVPVTPFFPLIRKNRRGGLISRATVHSKKLK